MAFLHLEFVTKNVKWRQNGGRVAAFLVYSFFYAKLTMLNSKIMDNLPKIQDWLEIEEYFKNGTLLVGNGGSMAVNTCFGYFSLLKYAKEHKCIAPEIQKLFDFFGTSDFELILRLVWQASNVNRALNITDDRTKKTYRNIRDLLINMVRDIHPVYPSVSMDIPNISNFIKKFRIILSLNYDLILYWATMYANQNDKYRVKDCFIHGLFSDDWRKLKKNRLAIDKKPSLIFYPHGNLVLARNQIEIEMKINADTSNLLEGILLAWLSEKYVPLFVSEGTSEQKLNSIKNSNYLSTVYHDILPTLSGFLTIYGWDIGIHDIHILKRMKLSDVGAVAISVYNNDESYCYRVYQMIKDHLGKDVKIYFFRSDSPNCWNNQILM